MTKPDNTITLNVLDALCVYTNVSFMKYSPILPDQYLQYVFFQAILKGTKAVKLTIIPS